MISQGTQSLAQSRLAGRHRWQPAQHPNCHAPSSSPDAADHAAETRAGHSLTPARQPAPQSSQAPALSTVAGAKIANAARQLSLPRPAVATTTAVVYLNHHDNTRFAVAYQEQHCQEHHYLLWFLMPPRQH